MSSDDAAWIASVLGQLQAPQAELVRELLGLLAELQADDEGELLTPQAVTLASEGSGTVTSEDRVRHQLRRRQAIYEHLRGRWLKTRSLPSCLWRYSVYKETAAFGHVMLAGSASNMVELVEDPLQECDGQPLTRESARAHAQAALGMARELGDQQEIGEAAILVARYHLLSSDFDIALSCCALAAEHVEATGALSTLASVYGLTDEIYSITKPDLDTRVENVARYCDVLRRTGSYLRLLNMLAQQARWEILGHDLERATSTMAEIEQAASVLTTPVPDPTEAGQIAHLEHGTRSLFHHGQGETDSAIGSAALACGLNARSPACREDHLLYDLAWLEALCQENRRDDFERWCDDWSGGRALDLRFWYLRDGEPGLQRWEEEWQGVDGWGEGWDFVDPLGRSSVTQDASGMVLQPVLGGGFFSNVTAPRALRLATSDFAAETVIDMTKVRTCAGGLLVFVNDHTLLRFGVGLQYEGEVTLTVKSARTGFAVVARGLIANAHHVHLRLQRRGDLFTAWCGDGNGWYSAGDVTLGLAEDLQVGIFAECSYRLYAIDRTESNPVCFKHWRFVALGSEN